MNKKYALVAVVIIALLFALNGLLEEAPQPVLQKPVAVPRVNSMQVPTLPKLVMPKVSAENKFSQAMGANISKVAMVYEQSMQYPNYSTPLSPENWDLLHPLQAIETQLPLAGDADTQVGLKMANYVIFHGDPIEANITVSAVSGLPDIQKIDIEILDGQTSLSSGRAQSVKKTASSIIYQIKIIPSKGQQSSWPLALQLAATVKLSDGANTSLFTSFKYSKKNLTLTGVNEAYVEDVDLIIPLMVKVHESGRYQFRANLFSQTGKTISHLVIKENLSKANSSIAFKVHSSLLRAANTAGPYVLKDFNITKVPTVPGDKTQYGFSEKESYEVNGFALDEYSDEPYVNEANVQRLQFLQKLSN